MEKFKIHLTNYKKLKNKTYDYCLSCIIALNLSYLYKVTHNFI